MPALLMTSNSENGRQIPSPFGTTLEFRRILPHGHQELASLVGVSDWHHAPRTSSTALRSKSWRTRTSHWPSWKPHWRECFLMFPSLCIVRHTRRVGSIVAWQHQACCTATNTIGLWHHWKCFISRAIPAHWRFRCLWALQNWRTWRARVWLYPALLWSCGLFGQRLICTPMAPPKKCGALSVSEYDGNGALNFDMNLILYLN